MCMACDNTVLQDTHYSQLYSLCIRLFRALIYYSVLLEMNNFVLLLSYSIYLLLVLITILAVYSANRVG